MDAQVDKRSFLKWMANLAVPLALQSIVTFGIGLADNIMVGSLGDFALSGVFLANQIQNILQMLTIGTGAAMIVLAVQYIGRQDVARAKAVISIAAKLVLVTGLLFTVIAALFPASVLRLFTQDEAAIQEGCRYLRISCFSYVFFCLNSVLLSAMRCVQKVKIGLVVSVFALCVNVFLNWVLIFGNLGAPAMGVAGAALATLITRMAELTVTLLYVRFADKELKLRLPDFVKLDTALLGDFLRHGMPVILGDVLWGIGGAVQAGILGRLGTEVMAANTIATNLFFLVSVAVFSMAGASGIIIGQTVGTGNYALVKAYTKILQIVFLCVGIFTGVVLFMVRDVALAVGFSGLSPVARQYAHQFMTVLSVTVVGTAYQMSTLTGIVRAGGATSFVLKNDIIFVWLIVIPSAMLSAFVFHFPPVVVFACLKCDQILKCAVAVVKVHRYDWLKKLTRD